jgi:hypothetical protein
MQRGQSVVLYSEYCIQRGGHIIKITNRFFESVAKPQYMGTTVTNQNFIHGEINITLNSGKIRTEARLFSSPKASRPALGPTQPSIQWVPGEISPGVKRPGREADHSPPSSA